MSNVTLDSEALAEAADDLSSYIEEIKSNISNMQKAARDCVDNMEHDTYSNAALDQIEKCIAELQKNLTAAEELRGRILAKKQEIEDSEKILN